CKDAELTDFRALLFESKRLKDTGRMHDDHIDCSAALGRLNRPRPLPKPDFLLTDGTAIYLDLPLYQNEDETVITLQSGDSYVVFRPETPVQLGPGSIHVSESVVDAPTRHIGWLRGNPLNINPALLTTDSSARIGDTLYVTRCSTRGLSCVTGYVSIPEALSTEQLPRTFYMVISGLTC